jgi:DNA-binding SARP family transcriptional activator/TolB-like protein
MSFRISVLGTSGLRDGEGRVIQSVLQQPRRFALLVYLALESRAGPARRDTVLGVFWPEKTLDNARGSLNQAVHYLRRSLGPDAILTHADSVEVNRALVRCDAVDLLDACDEGRWAEAAGLHGGELLPGYFDNGDSPEFEHWLNRARVNIRVAAARCAWEMAEAEEAVGNGAEAVVWARRASSWSLGHEAELRRLLELMARLGDRTGVLEAYETLRRYLEELEATPAPETKRLMERLRNRWEEEDRAVAPPGAGFRTKEEGRISSAPGMGSEGEILDREGQPTEADARGPDASGPPSGDGSISRGWSRSRRPGSRKGAGPLRRMASLAVTAGLMVAILSLWGLTRERPPTPSSLITLLVEDLLADGAEAPLARTLKGGVVGHLQEMTALRVVAEAGRESVVRERGFILRGDLLSLGQEFQATFHLVDGASGAMLASTRLEKGTADVPAALDELARSVAQFARREVGAALAARRLAEAPVPEQAIAMVRLGRQDMALGASLWRQSSPDAAVAAYRKADSMFAQATHLAPQWDLPWIDRAEAAYHLMWIERVHGEGGPAAAQELAARGVRLASEAIARDGRQAESLELRAVLLQWQWLLEQPDPTGSSGALLARSEADARRATELDPHRARAWNVLGANLLSSGGVGRRLLGPGEGGVGGHPPEERRGNRASASSPQPGSWATPRRPGHGVTSWKNGRGVGWPVTVCRSAPHGGRGGPRPPRAGEAPGSGGKLGLLALPGPGVRGSGCGPPRPCRGGAASQGESGEASGGRGGHRPASVPDVGTRGTRGASQGAQAILDAHVAEAPSLRSALRNSRRFQDPGLGK